MVNVLAPTAAALFCCVLMLLRTVMKQNRLIDALRAAHADQLDAIQTLVKSI